MTRPPPAPVSAPATTSRGVVGGLGQHEHRDPRRGEAGEDEEDRADPVGQPARRHARRRIAIPSATKKSPMFAPAASARCGRNADDDAPVRDVQQVDGDERRPRAPEREAEPTLGDVDRPVRVAGRLAARSESERDDPRRSRGRRRRTRRAITATPCSDVVARTASDSGGMTTRVRLWALPTNARPNPRRSRRRAWGPATGPPAVSRRCRSPGRRGRRGTAPTEPPGSTPGSSRMAQPMR